MPARSGARAVRQLEQFLALVGPAAYARRYMNTCSSCGFPRPDADPCVSCGDRGRILELQGRAIIETIAIGESVVVRLIPEAPDDPGRWPQPKEVIDSVRRVEWLVEKLGDLWDRVGDWIADKAASPSHTPTEFADSFSGPAEGR